MLLSWLTEALYGIGGSSTLGKGCLSVLFSTFHIFFEKYKKIYNIKRFFNYKQARASHLVPVYRFGTPDGVL